MADHYTTVGNIIDPGDMNNLKQEQKARKVAYEKLLPLNRIAEICRENNCSDKYELIDFLDVAEEFFDEAMDYYNGKHGLCAYTDNARIKFEPCFNIIFFE